MQDDDKAQKRGKKHSTEVKDMVQDKIMTLLTNLMDFHNNVDSAEDDLIRMFKFIKDRQNALLETSVALDEEYG